MKKTIYIRFTALLACLFFGCVTPDNMSQTNPPKGSKPSIDIEPTVPNEGPRMMLLRYDYPIHDRGMDADLIKRGQYFLDGQFYAIRVETKKPNDVTPDGTFSFKTRVKPKMFFARDSMKVTIKYVSPDRKVLWGKIDKDGATMTVPFVWYAADGYYHLSLKTQKCGKMHAIVDNEVYTIDPSYRNSVRLKFNAESPTTNEELEIKEATGSSVNDEVDFSDYQTHDH